MTTVTLPVEILINVTTFIASIGGAMFVAGTRWGKVQAEMQYINERLARIEGMFTLTPKDIRHGD